MSSIPTVTAADVERVIRRDFAPEQQAEARRLAEAYQDTEPHRVRLAAMKLADGDLAELGASIEIARSDYRDVLACAEYPAYSRLPFDAPKSDRLASDESDREQYERWLYR